MYSEVWNIRSMTNSKYVFCYPVSNCCLVIFTNTIYLYIILTTLYLITTTQYWTPPNTDHSRILNTHQYWILPILNTPKYRLFSDHNHSLILITPQFWLLPNIDHSLIFTTPHYWPLSNTEHFLILTTPQHWPGNRFVVWIQRGRERRSPQDQTKRLCRVSRPDLLRTMEQ